MDAVPLDLVGGQCCTVYFTCANKRNIDKKITTEQQQKNGKFLPVFNVNTDLQMWMPNIRHALKNMYS